MYINDDIEDVQFEKFRHRNTNTRKKSNNRKHIVFESPIDGFIGNFSNPSKIIEFVNKRYNISCYRDSVSRKSFAIKDKRTHKLYGIVFPAKN
jgi:hypothetical protein